MKQLKKVHALWVEINFKKKSFFSGMRERKKKKSDGWSCFMKWQEQALAIMPFKEQLSKISGLFTLFPHSKWQTCGGPTLWVDYILCNTISLTAEVNSSASTTTLFRQWCEPKPTTFCHSEFHGWVSQTEPIPADMLPMDEGLID